MSKHYPTESSAQKASLELWTAMHKHGFHSKEEAINHYPHTLQNVRRDLNECPACQYAAEQRKGKQGRICESCPLFKGEDICCTSDTDPYMIWVNKRDRATRGGKVDASSVLNAVKEWGKRL